MTPARILAKHNSGTSRDRLMACALAAAIDAHNAARCYPRGSTVRAVLQMRRTANLRDAWNCKHRLGERAWLP